jgi:predicted nucleotidyltransferase
MKSLLDLSDREALTPLAQLLATVRKAAGEAPLLLVGAAARDVLLVHAHGVEMQRATQDTDVAVAVASWGALLHVREALVAEGGFTADGPAHRLRLGDQRVDIIPFGGIELANRSIVWPQEDAGVMNVSGLAEALATAVAVRLPGGLLFDVASLPALALLKIWAWRDRRYIAPGKDAFDLWMLLRHNADAGNEDRLYGKEGEAALVDLDFDFERAGAWLLGHDARDVLTHGPDPRRSVQDLAAILEPEIEVDGALRLVAQMPPGDRERQLSLLRAFCAGLFG